MAFALAATHHDEDGRLYDQAVRVLPRLSSVYDYLTVFVTPTTVDRSRALLQSAGVDVQTGAPDLPCGHLHLGLWRRLAVAHALDSAPGATHIHFCDFDRLLHWAECHLDELRATLNYLVDYDFTVLGRTSHAFHSHPRAQRDTEGIVNHVFAQVSGLDWDVTAASRGLSRRAARAIVDGCDDNSIGSDCSWPLFMQRQPDLSLGYLSTAGLEFETLDRYPDEVNIPGGATAWIERHDRDPRTWAFRLEMARIEVEAIVKWKA